MEWVAPDRFARWSPPKVTVEEMVSAYRTGSKYRKDAESKGKPAAPFPFVVGETAGPGSTWRPPEQKARPHGGKAGSIESGRPPARPHGGKAAIAGSPSSRTVAQEEAGRQARAELVQNVMQQRQKSLPAGPERNARGHTIVDAQLIGQKALPATREPLGQMSLFGAPSETEAENFINARRDQTDRLSQVPSGMQPGRQVAAWAARPTLNKKPGSQGVLIQPRKYR